MTTLSASLILIIAFSLFPIQLFGIFTKEASVLELVYPYLPILVFSLINAGIRPVTRTPLPALTELQRKQYF